MIRGADARSYGPTLRDAARSTDLERRVTAVLSIGRLHDPAAYPELRAALRDPDGRVRDSAALGIGAYEADAPGGAEAALLASFAAEVDPEGRGERAWDLGRVGRTATLQALLVALDAEDPRVRVGACRGLAAQALVGRTVPIDAAATAVDRATRDPDVGVRRACAYAVGRIPATAALGPTAAATLEAATHDGDEEVRVFATRALGASHLGSTAVLVALTADVSYRVDVAAFRALAQRTADDTGAAYGAALGAASDRAMRPPHLVAPAAFPLLVGLEEAMRVRDAPALLPRAELLLGSLGHRSAPSRADGLAHCRAAALVDLAHGWPARVTRCGLGQVGDDERAEIIADLVAHLGEDAPRRATYLSRAYDRTPTPRARAAVLAAAAGIEDPAARVLLVRGVGEGDIGVVSAALEAAPPAAAWLRGGDPSVRLPTDLRTALVHAETTLAATDEVEGLVAWLDVVTALRANELTAIVEGMADHPCRAVRDHARATLAALGAAPSALPPRAPQNVIAERDVPARDARLESTITLENGRRIDLDLLPAEAPTTVARFVELAARHFFDGLTFHRVVPGFVVQGGDPRGDGFGGPGFTQRCEDNRVRYERGTVGMALAGRDTGGSQFFITTGPSPHLDGRYTAFGRVTRGMDAVDGILPGARIRMIRVTRR